MVNSTDAWRVIRTLRSQPPGLAADSGARRTTFQAALEQSEELWTAAERVGPSVSPILLFYSLNQAGYALLAARARGPWGSAGSHGARATYSSTGSGDRVHLDDFTVTPMGTGSISRIAQLSQSVLPSCPVSVADLICSLPQTEHLYARQGTPRPLLVHPGLAQDHRSTNRCLAISNLPPSLVRHEEERGLKYFVAPSPEEVVEWLGAYPTVAALGKPVSIVQGTPPDLHRLGIDVPVLLEWRHEEELPELVDFTTHPLLHIDHHAWAKRHIDVSLDWTTEEVAGWVLPALPGTSSPLRPLLTWWLLLFATSVAARYHSRQWTRLLRVDSSQDAVAVEEVLRLGAEEIPALLLHALMEETDDDRLKGAQHAIDPGME